jgi:transposase
MESNNNTSRPDLRANKRGGKHRNLTETQARTLKLLTERIELATLERNCYLEELRLAGTSMASAAKVLNTSITNLYRWLPRQGELLT